MACHVYEFEQRKWNHDAIAANLHTLIRYGAEYRDAFHQIANAVLSAKKLRCMRFPDFVLYPGKGSVHIRARRIIEGNICPGCNVPVKHDQLRFLQCAKEGAHQDLVVWGCMRCSAVFSRLEQKKEAGIDAAT